MSVFFITLPILITTTLSTTFTCTDLHCDFGTCTNNKCDGNTYICTSLSNHCQLDCESCTDITITSSAQDTEILCDNQNSCNQISINIQSDSPTNHDHNSLLLTCSHSTACTDIQISCNNDNNLCQCKDYDDTTCNTNVNGDFSQWHQHPNFIRMSIQDAYNHSNSNASTAFQSSDQPISQYSANTTDNLSLDDSPINTDTDVKTATLFVVIMFGLLFCILVLFGLYICIKKCICKCIEKIKMVQNVQQIKKETINSLSPRSESTKKLPIPTLGSEMGSATSILSIGSQASLDSQLQTPKLSVNGSNDSIITVSSLNISNSKLYAESMGMGV